LDGCAARNGIEGRESGSGLRCARQAELECHVHFVRDARENAMMDGNVLELESDVSKLKLEVSRQDNAGDDQSQDNLGIP